jgi:hypothetical protein
MSRYIPVMPEWERAEPSPGVPERKRRESPQAEVPGRAPLCPRCWFLRDTLGHVWACVAPNGRLRKRPARGGEAA